MDTDLAPEHPLAERVRELHAKAKAAGKVRPPAPPRKQVAVDWQARAAGEHRAA